MHKEELISLSKYRLEKSRDMLAAALRDQENNDQSSANNRAYYCIFHAMRAVLALDGKDFSKHAGVISYFTQNYLKPEILPKKYGKLITNASLIRNKSDYEDFYICSAEDTDRLIQGAKVFFTTVEAYLKARYTNEPAPEAAEPTATFES